MTGFTQRTVHRALGASGRIQPRIAPITAPDPWVTPATSDLGLEVFEEIEARHEPGGRRVHRAQPEALPEPEPRREPVRESPPEAALPREADPAMAAPERAVARRPVAPPVVPSFRARDLDVVSSSLVPRAPLEAPRVEELEGLDEGVTIVASGSPGAAERGHAEPAAPRSAAPREHATEVLAKARSASTRTSEPREGRALAAELDEASWRSPSLEPMPVRRGRRGAAEAGGPVVRIEIGKVELRAPSPAPVRAPAGIAKPAAFVSLQQYLHKRGAS